MNLIHRFCGLFVIVWAALPETLSIPSYWEYNEMLQRFVNRSIPLPADSWSLHPNFSRSTTPLETFKFQGQHGEDQIILTIFDDKQDGFFLDLAAHAWKLISNTFVLEHFNNWRGICIEANPIYIEGLLAHRKCMVFKSVVGERSDEKVYFDFKSHDRKIGGVIGGIVGEHFDNHDNRSAVAQTTVSLEKLLEFARAPAVIDYFSLDVEGAEFFVMKRFPFNRFTFLTLTVERPTKLLHQLLASNGYAFVKEITGNRFGECLYVHKSLHNFNLVVHKYHQAEIVPSWFGEKRPYLLHPKLVFFSINLTNSIRE